MRCVLLLGIALFSASCARPKVPVVCHNAHCTGPSDPTRDDTLDSLKASLALRTGDRPTIDGVEIDTFWSAAASACLFTHDLEKEGVTPPPVSEAVAEVVKHLENTGPATFRSERFLVFLEMKPETTPPPKQPHTAEQADLHADCVLDLVDTLRDAATRTGKPVEVTITSFEHTLLEALTARPRWTGKHPGETLQLKLGAVQGTPPPLSSTSRPFGLYNADIDTAEVHPGWMTDAYWRLYKSRGLTIGFWMFSATAETLDAIDTYAPDLVVTSEAPLLRGWMESR